MSAAGITVPQMTPTVRLPHLAFSERRFADLVLPVPDGTVVTDMQGTVLADLVGVGTEMVIAQGGRGGLGNAALARMLRRRSGLRLHDLGPMRAARREALLELGLTDRRFGYPLEMVTAASDAGAPESTAAVAD